MRKIRRILFLSSLLSACRILWVWFVGGKTEATQTDWKLFPQKTRITPRAPLPIGKPACLICQGGGAQGAWQAGVISRLLEEGIEFKSLHGTSAGALNAAMTYSGKTPEDFRRVWCDTSWHHTWMWSPIANLKDGAIASGRPLKDLIARELGADALRHGRIAGKYLYIWVTDLDGETPRLVQCFGTRRDTPFEDFLLASCSIPGFFSAVNIVDGNGDQSRFCDGGLVSNNPMKFIGPSGMAGLNFVIDICPYTRPHKSNGILNSALSAVMKEQTRSTLKIAQLELDACYSEEHYGPLHFYVIQPSRPLKSALIPLAKSVRKEDFALGYADAELFLAGPRDYWLPNLNFDTVL